MPASDRSLSNDCRYSYAGNPRGSGLGAVSWEDFPGLSGSLACSPVQYGKFMQAYLSGLLVSEVSMREMTRGELYQGKNTCPWLYSTDLSIASMYTTLNAAAPINR